MLLDEGPDGWNNAERVLRGIAPSASVNVYNPCGFEGRRMFGRLFWEPDVQVLEPCCVKFVRDRREVRKAWNVGVTGVRHGWNVDVFVFMGLEREARVGCLVSAQCYSFIQWLSMVHPGILNSG